MRVFHFILLLLFLSNLLLAQETHQNTTGDNSPNVLTAQNFSATYGVRVDAVEAIL